MSVGVCLMSNHECVNVATDVESGHVLFGIYIKECYLTNLYEENKKKIAC